MLSRSNTYTTLNALAGHFNSFGNAQPLPKKRFERAVKVLPPLSFQCCIPPCWCHLAL